jgi:hypothetical protein
MTLAMLIRYGPSIVAAAALAGAVWYVMALRADNAALEAENASLTRSIAALEQKVEQSAEARRVEAVRAKRWAERAAELDASIEAMYTGDIPDVPLDPRIIAILDSL